SPRWPPAGRARARRPPRLAVPGPRPRQAKAARTGVARDSRTPRPASHRARHRAPAAAALAPGIPRGGCAMMAGMTLHTPFTEMFDLQHPIARAPMGQSAGGALAAAVAGAGGLGLVGGASGAPAWLDRELPAVARDTEGAWGVGFLTWAIKAGAVEHALSYRPRAIMLSFGDPAPYTPP